MLTEVAASFGKAAYHLGRFNLISCQSLILETFWPECTYSHLRVLNISYRHQGHSVRPMLPLITNHDTNIYYYWLWWWYSDWQKICLHTVANMGLTWATASLNLFNFQYLYYSALGGPEYPDSRQATWSVKWRTWNKITQHRWYEARLEPLLLLL